MVPLTIEPPLSSRTPSRSPLPILVGALAVAFVAGGAAGFWIGRRTAPAPAEPPAQAAAPAAASTPATAGAPAAPGTSGTAGPAASADAAIPAPAPTATAPVAASPPPVAQPAPAGPRRLAIRLTGPLEESVAAALPRDDRAVAAQLTQVVNRLLVWDLHVAKDGRKGDTLDVVFEPAAAGGASAEPVVEAVRYTSQKLGKTIAAYRFRAEGATWARYYRPDGTEVEERLVDSPIRDYDQVTSLLRDGRRHKGVDFRTPAGTPVYAPFDGVIERRNWNFAGNGNCLDIRDAASGRHAIFLHLEVLPKDMAVGRRVKKGERIASSGNSGHSFAPHLHYQLEAPDGRVLDPFAIHATTRAALSGPAKAAFDAARAKLDGMLAAR